jgi:hypothetical protein
MVMKFLLYTLVVVILSFCFVCVKLVFHAPDHIDSYTASVLAITGLLIIIFKLLPLIHKAGSDDSAEVDDGGE